jgi:hypothetical protein
MIQEEWQIKISSRFCGLKVSNEKCMLFVKRDKDGKLTLKKCAYEYCPFKGFPYNLLCLLRKYWNQLVQKGEGKNGRSDKIL